MRLETADEYHVADVQPVASPFAAALPDDVVIWGARVFVKEPDEGVWRETLPMVVHADAPAPVSLELGRVAYDGYRTMCEGRALVSGAQLPAWDEQTPAIREAWRGAADAVAMALQLQSSPNVARPVRSAWAEAANADAALEGRSG